jgi:glycosyltransferase involved in cell wall biosynthesis
MRRPLRVCFLNPYGYRVFDGAFTGDRVRPFGGPEVQFYFLATALARYEDVAVNMIVEGTPDRVAPEAEGVRMLPVPPQPAWHETVQRFVPIPMPGYQRLMREADADVYVQRGGAVITGDVARFCSRAGRRFLWMAAHDRDCDHHLGAGNHFRVSGLYYRYGLRRADRVLVQSESQRAELSRRHGIEATVFRTVYPDDTGTAGTPGTPGTAGTPGVREHVLWVGRCVGWKRPMAFLDLAARFPETRFVMICPEYPGSEALAEEVRRRAGALANVTLHGFVPFDETAGFFRRALAFVNTSDHEGFPNTFIQSARAGVPVISLRVDPDGMLGREGMGASAGGDTGRLADELGKVLVDGGPRERYAERGRAYFLREHDLASGIETFRALLPAPG